MWLRLLFPDHTHGEQGRLELGALLKVVESEIVSWDDAGGGWLSKSKSKQLVAKAARLK